MKNKTHSAETRLVPVNLRFELSHLETFIAVAQLGSFSLAAQQLHITQPSVTSRIQRLEDMLGVKLLIRTTRSIKVTPQGAQLLDEATATLQGLRDLVEKFRQQAESARQRVVVAATPMLAAMTLPPIIHSYSEHFPGVQIDLRDLRYEDALNSLMTGEADIAVLALEEDDQRFDFQPIREDDMVLVVPSEHQLASRREVSLDEISAFPILMLEQYEPMLVRISEALNRHELKLKRALSAGNLATLLGMLDAKMGITLLTRSMARRSQQAGHVVIELSGIRLTRAFGIVTRRNAKPGTTVQSFCRHLKQAKATPPAIL